MPVKSIIKVGEYHDSVSLMLVAQALSSSPGVSDAAVVMATEANKGILAQAGLLDEAASAANSNDLVIAISAEDEASSTAALQLAETLLKAKVSAAQSGEFHPRTIHSAAAAHPEANLAVISIAGRYAANEAWQALRAGLHVLLFSDNVSLEDEIALKKYAVDHGLLLMGPGAGTAIINGVALGFANVLPAGPVGIVSAAGTGLQEVSTLLAKQGVGITQGIGTGGRDLKEEVGGRMMLAGLRALQADPATKVLLLVSKPPAASVTEEVLDQIASGTKPAVVCFLGGNPAIVQAVPNAVPARTLQEAALITARLAGASLMETADLLKQEDQQLKAQASSLSSRLAPEQQFLRGLFSGGTLCYETQLIWQELLAEAVYSNAPLRLADKLPDSNHSQGHSAVDLGEEEFTVGRPHPMIDNDLRIRRLLQEARDPGVAVILLDVVIGYGAHPDPAAELARAVGEARQIAAQNGHKLIVVASVTGTSGDPQGLEKQTRLLEGAQVIVCGSNAAAARLAAYVVQDRSDEK
ncbi:MAG: bacterial FdrA family protein [Chloroflexi bacterium]|nr:bacterial FdrA family protein [Chloroflexota bacterium]